MIWEKTDQKFVYDGYRKILSRNFNLPDGRTSEFEIIYSEPTVCILAFTEEENIILCSQYRPGPEKILLELPGGVIEKNETPYMAAQRELLEETGFTGNIEFIGTNYHSAYSTRIKYNFIALSCKKYKKQELDKNEFIEIIEMPVSDFRDHLKKGELTDIETGYLGLDYLGLL